MDRIALLEARRARLKELKKQRLQRQEHDFPIKQSPGHTYSAEDVDSIVKEVLHKEKEATPTPSLTVSEPVSENFNVEVVSEPITPISNNLNKRNALINIYDKAVETDTELVPSHNVQIDEEEFKRLELKVERRLTEKLTTEIRLKLEKEFQMKLQRAKQLEEEVDQIIKPVVPTASTETLQNGLVEQDAENLDRDSKYAQEIPTDHLFSLLDSNSLRNVKSVHELFCDDTKEMQITSIDISPFYPELVVVSYALANRINLNTNRHQFRKPKQQSILIIWNTETDKVEFSLLSYSPITVAKFSKSKSNEIIAGLRNGKLCLWKLNSKSRYPAYTTTTLGKPGNEHSNNRTVSITHRLNSNQRTKDNKGYHPIVGIYETTNSIISLDSNGQLNMYSTNLITLISQQHLMLPGFDNGVNASISTLQTLPKKFIITSNFIDLSYLILGLSTGEVFSVKINQLDSIKLIFKNYNKSFPVMSIDKSLGFVVASGLDYKIRFRKLIESSSSTTTTNGSSSSTTTIAVDDEEDDLNIVNTTNLISCVRFKNKSVNEFVTVSLDNKVEFWDLAINDMTPVEFIQLGVPKKNQDNGVDSEKMGNEYHAVNDEECLNVVKWSNNSEFIVCGGLSGKLYLLKLQRPQLQPVSHASQE